MSRKAVCYTIGLASPSPLTEAQQAELERLAALPDEAIDTSETPEPGEAFWATRRASAIGRCTGR